MVKEINNRESGGVLEVNKVYVGNCLEELRKLPSESIDMCVTSPPYWGLRDYGTEGQIWGGDPDCEHDFTVSKRKLHSGTNSEGGLPHHLNANKVDWEVEDMICNKCGAWKGELGLEPSPDMFVDHLCDIFDEVKRVLAPHGTCWVNLGDTYANTGHGKGTGNMQNKNVPGAMTPKVKCDLPQKCLVQIPSRFAIEMTNRGWILRNEIIWYKPSCMPASIKDRYTVDFEKMFFFAKNKKYYFKQQLEPLVTPIETLRKDKRGKGWDGKGAGGSKKVNSVANHGGNKSMGETMNPNGRNKRTVWKHDVPDVPYSVQPRKKDYVYFRELPKHDEIREYLKEWKDKIGITIDEIEEHFGNSKGHHWFEKDGSYPSVDDWWTLKDLLEFDDKYDKDLTTEYEKSSEKTTTSPNSRNKRTVWAISPKGFKDAHFAVYPPELIESPIDAGCPEWVDKKTGKPRERNIEKKSLERYELPEDHPNYRPAKYETKYDELHDGNSGQKYAVYDDKGYDDGRDDSEFRPGIVLDPFFGSGTTGEVAMKQDKDWVGIELNGDYVKISDKRLKPTIIEKKTRDKASEFWS